MTTPDTKAIRAQMDALSGFAPGPWKVSPTDDTTVITHDRNMVAEIDGDYNEPDLWPIMEANARLIAAAPDMRDTILAICDALDEAREAATVRQQNARDTFDAMVAMRDSINEHIPMPSLESDLAQGPEHSVFCAVVAEAVIGEVGKLRAENERLTVERGSLIQAAKYVGASFRKALDRAEKAEAENERLRNALVEIAHTFTERSDGTIKTYSASFYQEIARAALGQDGDV